MTTLRSLKVFLSGFLALYR